MDVSPARQVESPDPGLVSVSQQGPREGITGGGLVRRAHPVGWIAGFLHENIRRVKIKESEPGSQARKGRKIKSIKLEMKIERSQQTTQKYKGS